MIETDIKLSTGERVKGYYLDKKDIAYFRQIKTLIDNSIAFKVERTRENVDLLYKVLRKQINQYLEAEVIKRLAKLDKNRSYHLSDLMDIMSGRGLWATFQRLIGQGLLVYRGSGWYRIASPGEKQV